MVFLSFYRLHLPWVMLLAAMLIPAHARAQSVAMSGSMGNKALLVVDGSAPKAVSVGQVHKGVKVLAVNADQVTVEVNGKKMVVVMGGSPVSAGRAAVSGGNQIVLTAGSGGHFRTQGSINGRSVEFMVDTGATLVAMSADEAKRLGIAYETGQKSLANTANGVVGMYVIRLQKVRIQDVEVHDVEAAVSLGRMNGVLLGNSFLTRFQMKRENDQLTLTRRF